MFSTSWRLWLGQTRTVAYLFYKHDIIKTNKKTGTAELRSQWKVERENQKHRLCQKIQWNDDNW
jgi:hypothetical protein